MTSRGDARQKIIPKSVNVPDIRSKIPAHLFEQNTFRSIGYLLRDFAQIAATAAAMYYLFLPIVAKLCGTGEDRSNLLAWPLLAFGWSVYWTVQGVNFTAVWILAHECGHRAFSSSLLVNDIFGLVLHSALLVPFHAWRITHGNHHKHTNHCDLDTVFVPIKMSEPLREAIGTAPIVSFVQVIVMLTLGWPGYLFANVASQKSYPKERQNHDKQWVNHFDPASPIFEPRDRADIIISNVFILIALVCIGYAISVFGFANVFFWYGVPYLHTNGWLVYITYLQHSDERIPHYNNDEFTFVRGALAAVDRDFGSWLNPWLHHIHDSHVVHHLFSTMPFFHAIEVTRKHLTPLVGEYYITEKRQGLWGMVWQSWRNCLYVVPSEGVAFYRR